MIERSGHKHFLAGLILSAAIFSAGFGGEVGFVGVEGAAGHAYVFVVDPIRSRVAVTARVLGQNDSDESPATGWIQGRLTPGEAPFGTMHITDMAVDLTEQIDLSYRWLFLGTGWARGSEIGVDMNEAGAESLVEGDGSFVQGGNSLSARGTFAYDMPTVGAGEVELGEMGDVRSDLAGTVRQDGTTITLQFDIDIEYPLEIEGATLGTAWIQGTIVATAELYWAAADFDGNGVVNFWDFAFFGGCWPSETGETNFDPG